MKIDAEPRLPDAIGSSGDPRGASPAAGSGARTIALAAAVSALVLGLVLPRATPASMALLLAASAMTAMRRPADWDFNRVPPAAIAAFAFAGWALLSVVWAADRSEAAGKALFLALLTAALWVNATVLLDPDREQLNRTARAVAIAFCGCVAFLLFEEASGQFLKRVLLEKIPLLRPSSKHVMGGDADVPLMVSTYITNRNMAVMTLSAWPCLLLIQKTAPARWRVSGCIAAFAAVAATATMSAHETSMIAMALSAVVLVIALRLPRLATGIVAAGWIAATLLVVPAALMAFHQFHLQSAKWLPNSARHRIVLWAYTAEEVAKHPLIGVGAASTKVLDARRGPKVELAPGTPYEWRSAPHAHNVYLQTWYELGAVGAALLLTLGLAIVRHISRLPPGVAPYALASFAASAIAASFSWGLWQAWFMAALGLAAQLVIFSIATSNARPTSKT